jgi:hypothetical protein
MIEATYDGKQATIRLDPIQYKPAGRFGAWYHWP